MYILSQKRTLSIFLNRTEHREVEAFQSKYDSLYTKIPPHITLVFPFASGLTLEEIVEVIQPQLDPFSPFSISLHDTMVADDGCLYLLVDEGAERLIQLHNALYTGPLRRFKFEAHTYKPHVTIGRFSDMKKALDGQKEASRNIPFTTFKVDQVTIETIGKTEESIIEAQIPLEF